MLWVMGYGFRKERMKKEKKNCGFKGRGNNYLKLWEFFYMVELIL
jgi:hypothetical protein